ncbi:cytosolic Fe-S cluster assembly factor NBP35 [Trifolium repens]|nr:cytosolic Fe-S cluster assembly factor NBP35 [Trifolium repens]
MENGDIPEDANERPQSDSAGKSDSCQGCPNQQFCATAGPDPDMIAIAERMATVKHKILVMSGKGGVGKSTFSAQLAFALAARDFQVGLLDIDICGPSIPKMLGLEGQELNESNFGLSPVYVEYNLAVMSIGFMDIQPDEAIIWRGSRKTDRIKKFLKDVYWDELDFLIVDTPPGTSDEQITIVKSLGAANVDGAIIVTTPQQVSLTDVKKGVDFCKQIGVKVLGVVENMSGLSQPISNLKFSKITNNGEMKDVTEWTLEYMREKAPEMLNFITCSEVFDSSGGGAIKMCNEMEVPFLGKVPLDPQLCKAAEEGRSCFTDKNCVLSAPSLQNIIDKMMETSGLSMTNIRASMENVDIPEDGNEHCPGPQSDSAGKSDSRQGSPNQKICATVPKGPDPDMVAIAERMPTVKHKILVMSGKGGVGKSTFSAQLAFALAARDFKVGLLDIDICGPSIPKMVGLEGQTIHQGNLGWLPLYVESNLAVMSLGLIISHPNTPVIWKGPRKNELIRQFIKGVYWNELDFLIVDNPPGTSDEQIEIVQGLGAANIDGAIIVTTPQQVSLIDVKKEVNFCYKTGVKVLGVVENMSGLSQPISNLKFMKITNNGEMKDVTEWTSEYMREKAPELLNLIVCSEVFDSSGGGAIKMCSEMKVPFLGKVPLDPQLCKAAEEGRSCFTDKDCVVSASALQMTIDKMMETIGLQKIIDKMMEITVSNVV